MKEKNLTTIWTAIKSDNKEHIKSILEINFNALHKLNKKGQDVLLYVVKKDAINCLRYLVEEININILASYSPSEANLFHFAAQEGAIKILKYFLENSLIDISVKTKYNQTALHYAAICGQAEAVKFLLNAGCAQNSGDHYNNTPLHYAALNGREEIVELLIEFGCNLWFNNNAETPIDYAIINGHQTVFNFLANKLLSKTLPEPQLSLITAKDWQHNWLWKAITLEHIKIVEDILERINFNIEMIDLSLPIAIASEKWKILDYLLKVGEIDVQNVINHIRLEELLPICKLGALQWLIESKIIDINYTNVNEKSLLNLAIEQNDLEKISYLFKNKCKVTLKKLEVNNKNYEIVNQFIKEKLSKETKLASTDIKILKLCQFILNNSETSKENSPEKDLINDYISRDLITLSGVRKVIKDSTNQDPYTLLNLPQEIQKVIFNEVPLYLIGPGSEYLTEGKYIEIAGNSEAVIEDLI